MLPRRAPAAPARTLPVMIAGECLITLRLFICSALDRLRSAIDLVPRCIGTASRHPIIVTTRAILSIRARQGRGHHGDQEPKPNSNSLHSIAPRSAGPSHLSHSLILCDVSVLAEPANGSPKSPRHDRKGTGRLPASPDVRQPRPAFRWAFDSDVCSAGLSWLSTWPLPPRHPADVPMSPM